MDLLQGLHRALHLVLVQGLPDALLDAVGVAHGAGVGQQENILGFVFLIQLGAGLEEGVNEELGEPVYFTSVLSPYLEELGDPDQLHRRRLARVVQLVQLHYVCWVQGVPERLGLLHDIWSPFIAFVLFGL